MVFIHKETDKQYFLYDGQHESLWERGYLTVYGCGEVCLSFIKMEDLKPVLTHTELTNKYLESVNE